MYVRIYGVYLPIENKQKLKNMATASITIESLEIAFSSELSKIAKEKVTAQIFDKDLFVFASELACLRIANSIKSKETNVAYSENRKTYYVAIYSYIN